MIEDAFVDVTLVGDDSSGAHRLSVTTELARLLVRAKRFGEKARNGEEFDLSFSTLLYGFLAASDPCSQFFRGQAQSKLDLQALLRRKGLDMRAVEEIAKQRITADDWSSPLRATRSARNLLDNAAELHAHTGGPSVDTRHLLAAFVYEPAGHDRDLESIGFRRVAWSKEFRTWLSKKYPIEAPKWDALDARTFQHEGSAALGEPPTPTMERATEVRKQPRLPTSVADDMASQAVPPASTDNARGHADAAATTASPPSSRDGSTQSSGRSTPPEPLASSRWDRPPFDNETIGELIPLEKDQLEMRDEVERLARLLAASDVKPPIAIGLFGRWGSGKSFFMGMLRHQIAALGTAARGTKNNYVANVAQITFNAWHYHDTDIWAGLALRIYEGLAITLGGKTPAEVTKKRAELHEHLASSKAQVEEATRQRNDAQALRKRVVGELADRQRERQRVQEQLSIRRLLKITKDAKFAAARKTLVDELGRTLGKSPNDAQLANVEELREMARKLRDVGESARAPVAVLLSCFRDLKSTVISCLVMGASLLVVFLLHQLASTKAWSAFFEGILQVGSVLIPGLAWIGSRLRSLAAAKLAADEMRQMLTAPPSEPPSDEEKTLADRIQELDAAIRLDAEKIAAAEQRSKDAEAEIQRINAGGLVYDFVQQRGEAEAYVTQLGLVSTIRRDFEKLGDLLADLRKNGTRPIDRIVLYVDDLDRCHPDKVVQVLQAVHLLLAFDLFSVVVGVDARWLERSLERVYVGKDAAAENSPFSPQNYLEKIFQIPYSLTPMTESGFTNLIADLVVTRSERSERRMMASMQTSNISVPAGERTSAANASPATLSTTPVMSPADEARADQPPADSASKQDATAPQRVVDVREEVQSLFLEDFEEVFLKKFHAFVSTPRLAKRFVNLYRLLRTRASQEDFESFATGATSGTYRQALILLAIHIGYPRVGGRILYLLCNSSTSGSLREFLGDLAAKPAPDMQWTQSDIADLSAISAKVTSLPDADCPSPLDAYVHWAPRIGCYAFDWHLISDTIHRRPTTTNSPRFQQLAPSQRSE